MKTSKKMKIIKSKSNSNDIEYPFHTSDKYYSKYERDVVPYYLKEEKYDRDHSKYERDYIKYANVKYNLNQEEQRYNSNFRQEMTVNSELIGFWKKDINDFYESGIHFINII